jgi:2-keto-3-deoxy-L-rhamnonate aldolase RhmA
MIYRTNKMKQLLLAAEPVYSCTVGIPHPNLAEIAGLAGMNASCWMGSMERLAAILWTP